MISVARIIKTGFQNFWRNGLLSLATTLVLTLTLFTISIFVSLTIFANAAIQSVNSRIDVVVYFNDEVAEDEIKTIEEEVKQLSNVRETNYVTKEQALEKWMGKIEDESLKQSISPENNPLPRSLEVKVKDPEHTQEIADYFQQEEIAPKVHRVRYNKEVIDKLVRYTATLKKIGLALVIIFVVISIFVVFNTIRLAIYARRDEIEIMKLVGATSSYIRWPFVVEGTLFGVFAAIIVSLVTIFGGRYLFSTGFLPIGNLNEILNFLGPNAADYFSSKAFTIVLYQIVVGIVLSVGCSLIAIRRYLKI